MTGGPSLVSGYRQFGGELLTSGLWAEQNRRGAADSLAASLWTRNGGTAHKLASRTRSGTVWINCHNVFDASLPFGGYKQSGWGREMGYEAIELYTEVKAVAASL